MWDSLGNLLTSNRELLAALGNLVTILGVPSGIFVFLLSKWKERRAKEYETYSALDDRYIEFQRLCIEHPQLDLHELADDGGRVPTETEKLQQQAAYAILFSIFERAFIMFEDQTTPMRRRQWQGWEDYMRYYFKRERVRAAWETLSRSGQYDMEFGRCVQRKLISQPQQNATS
jgi:hypothetical protein